MVRLLDSFVFRGHLCLVFELLSINLYELIKMNQHRGFSINLLRVFLKQIIEAQIIIAKSHTIHCDLKPENILLCELTSPHIKIIDFGSACKENQTIFTYIQSRFYRSPEVILGIGYSSAIDIWSIGCIAAELFFGLPLFPGHSEYNQICRIVDMFGLPPTYMLAQGITSFPLPLRSIFPLSHFLLLIHHSPIFLPFLHPPSYWQSLSFSFIPSPFFSFISPFLLPSSALLFSRFLPFYWIHRPPFPFEPFLGSSFSSLLQSFPIEFFQLATFFVIL